MRWIPTLLFLAVLVAGFAVRKAEPRREEEEFRRLSDSLDARIAAYEARERPPRLPPFGEPVPGEAWAYYEKAYPLLESFEEPLWEVDYGDFALSNVLCDIKVDGSPPPEVLLAYRELAEPACLLMILGARAAEVGTGLDLGAGCVVSEDDGEFDSIPCISAARDPLLVRAAALAAEGDAAGAVDTLLVLHRLGEDVGDLPSLIHHLVGMAVRERALEGLSGLAGAGVLPETELARIVRFIDGPSGRPRDPRDVIEGERLYMEATLRAFARGQGGLEWMARNLTRDPPARGDRIRWWAAYRAAVDAGRAASDEGNPYERFGVTLATLENDESFVENVGGPPDFDVVRRATEKDRARYRALRMGIAAVRAARAGRRWTPPKSDADLVFREVHGKPAIYLAADLEDEAAPAEWEEPFFRLK